MKIMCGTDLEEPAAFTPKHTVYSKQRMRWLVWIHVGRLYILPFVDQIFCMHWAAIQLYSIQRMCKSSCHSSRLSQLAVISDEYVVYLKGPLKNTIHRCCEKSITHCTLVNNRVLFYFDICKDIVKGSCDLCFLNLLYTLQYSPYEILPQLQKCIMYFSFPHLHWEVCVGL